MPFPNEHAARVASIPSGAKVRRKRIAEGS